MNRGDGRLHALAYQMLGTVEDAEDVVQEAHLRMHQLTAAPVERGAYLFKVVTNLSIDRLRSARRTRRLYTGPWLPEPLPMALVEDNGELAVQRAESLRLGLIMLLEVLGPAERAVYVLREAFDLDFSDIAAMLAIREATVRQRLSRARRRLQEAGAPSASRDLAQESAEVKHMLDALLAAIASADVGAIKQLLHEDAIAYADGGGVVSAALIPITGTDRIAQVMLHLGTRVWKNPGIAMHWHTINGVPALVLAEGRSVHSCLLLEVKAGRAFRLYTVRHPDKLDHLENLIA